MTIHILSSVTVRPRVAGDGDALHCVRLRLRPCAPAPLATSCGGAPVTSRRDLAVVTRRAREQHAPARAGCVISLPPLDDRAAPSAPIGRPPPAPRVGPCLVSRTLAERFIRLRIADETTRLSKRLPRDRVH
ncbi:unnamed protein product [Euphydryas editha]|uniref:Uncharacterized protein n=1 Tax=Euphydryas editha TaxID=104508 RepID=A0AAU9V0I0_EUPED|nr:unnamed protein product [Euphydryas editha]